MVCNSMMIYDGLVVQEKDTQILIILGTAMYMAIHSKKKIQKSHYTPGTIAIQNISDFHFALIILRTKSHYTPGTIAMAISFSLQCFLSEFVNCLLNCHCHLNIQKEL